MKNIFIKILFGVSLLLPLSSCGEKTSKVSIEEKWSDVTYIWAKDYSSCKATRVWVTDSDRKQEESVKSTYEIVSEAKCETAGVARYVADFENPDFETQYKEVSIPAIKHDYQFDSFVWNEYSAKAKYICSHDSSHVQLYDAVMTFRITSIPTCSNGGVKVHVATYDGHTDEKTEVLTPLDHDWGEPTYKLVTEDSMLAEVVCNNNPSHTYSEQVVGVYSLEKSPTEEEDGLERLTFTFESPIFETQTIDTVLHKLPYGSMPHLSSDGKTMVYGIYPQTRVSDEDLCEAISDNGELDYNSWYYYDGNYYFCEYCQSYQESDDYTFDDGAKIKKYRNYWFKCEPIVWNVLESNNGVYTLLSSVLLQALKYDNTNKNNYEESSIRWWLNNTFYERAFRFNYDPIQITAVDNSASTTDGASNPFCSDETQDKVYLLSYKDYISSKYGFSTSSYTQSETRYCKTTDYARATGACISTSSDTKSNGHYWTRSPNSGNVHYASYICLDGSIRYDNNVSYSYLCVRPAINIKINNI